MFQPKLADISVFESLGNHISTHVFNSDAALMLQNYDHAKRSEHLCGKYIDDLQHEDFIPAELISMLYEAKEKFNSECMEVRQQLMEQATQEPLDQFDRQVFVGMSKDAQKDLQAILEADEVFQRALAMKEEQEQPEEHNEKELQFGEEEEPQENHEEPQEDEEDIAADVDSTEEEDLDEF